MNPKHALSNDDPQDPQYRAYIRSSQDYYPFGLRMQDRQFEWQFDNYRFGFNGKERDKDEEWGAQTHYDYGFRIYNPAIARFLSVDPLSPDYPELTPYQFASLTPIQAIDLDGLEMLDADASLIEITGGGTFLKLENASNPTKVRASWARGYIDMERNEIYSSFPMAITTSGLNWTRVIEKVKIARDGIAAPQNANESLTETELVDNRRFQGNSQQRRTQRRAYDRERNTLRNQSTTILPTNLGRGAGIGVAVGVIMHTINKINNRSVRRDFEIAQQQFKNEGVMSTIILLDNMDLVPTELLDNVELSSLTNYIYQGTLPATNDESLNGMIVETALLIMDRGERVQLNAENRQKLDEYNRENDCTIDECSENDR